MSKLRTAGQLFGDLVPWPRGFTSTGVGFTGGDVVPWPFHSPRQLVGNVTAADARLAGKIGDNGIFLISAFADAIDGASNPELQPVIYIQFPPDGIWELKFTVSPPMPGPRPGNPRTPIFGFTTFVWQEPERIKGFRISGETNSIVATV